MRVFSMDVGRVERMNNRIHFGVSTQVVPAPISSPTQLAPQMAPRPFYEPLFVPQVAMARRPQFIGDVPQDRVGMVPIRNYTTANA